MIANINRFYFPVILFLYSLFILSCAFFYHGWLADDWMHFIKAIHLNVNPAEALLERNNVNHTLMWLYSAVFHIFPLKYSISDIFLGNFVQYRVILYVVIFYHIFCLIIFYFIISQFISQNIAISSTILLMIDPEFNFWIYQNDSRFLPLFPILLVFYYSILQLKNPGVYGVRLAVPIGFLLYLSQSIHYTALYSVVSLITASVIIHEKLSEKIIYSAIIICSFFFCALFYNYISLFVTGKNFTEMTGLMNQLNEHRSVRDLSLILMWEQFTNTIKYYAVSMNSLWSYFYLFCLCFSFFANKIIGQKIHRFLVIYVTAYMFIILMSFTTIPFWRKFDLLIPILYILVSIGMVALYRKSRENRYILLIIILIGLIEFIRLFAISYENIRSHMNFGYLKLKYYDGSYYPEVISDRLNPIFFNGKISEYTNRTKSKYIIFHYSRDVFSKNPYYQLYFELLGKEEVIKSEFSTKNIVLNESKHWGIDFKNDRLLSNYTVFLRKDISDLDSKTNILLQNRQLFDSSHVNVDLNKALMKCRGKSDIYLIFDRYNSRMFPNSISVVDSSGKLVQVSYSDYSAFKIDKSGYVHVESVVSPDSIPYLSYNFSYMLVGVCHDS
jgi:hypothetical protein